MTPPIEHERDLAGFSAQPRFPNEGSGGAITLEVQLPALPSVRKRGIVTSGDQATVRVWVNSLPEMTAWVRTGLFQDLQVTLTEAESSASLSIPQTAESFDPTWSHFGVYAELRGGPAPTDITASYSQGFTRVWGGLGVAQGDIKRLTAALYLQATGTGTAEFDFHVPAPSGDSFRAKAWWEGVSATGDLRFDSAASEESTVAVAETPAHIELPVSFDVDAAQADLYMDLSLGNEQDGYEWLMNLSAVYANTLGRGGPAPATWVRRGHWER